MTTDPACHHATLLAKALELRFLAELSSALWRNGCRDFEVLRSETDTAGYDVVIGANGVVRHIQLKAMIAGGKRMSVTVHTRLCEKPAGCVVWMTYDPETLELGPFRYLGAGVREPLPALGDKVARHTKANAEGRKGQRPAHRVIRRTAFCGPEPLDQLSARLFGIAVDTPARAPELQA